MALSYFSRLFPHIQKRIREDIPSALPQSNDSLRRCLDAMISGTPGEETSLIGDPAFEGTFGWKQASVSMAELAGVLLDERLIRCLNAPPEELRQDYAFPPSRRPYTHQLEAWKILCCHQQRYGIGKNGMLYDSHPRQTGPTEHTRWWPT